MKLREKTDWGTHSLPQGFKECFNGVARWIFDQAANKATVEEHTKLRLLQEITEWCRAHGDESGFPMETRSHPGYRLAHMLRLAKHKFSEAEESQLMNLKNQYPQQRPTKVVTVDAIVKNEPQDVDDHHEGPTWPEGISVVKE
jgi:hypothetical protein